MLFLVLGEALVGLICEQPADGIADATAFAPHFDGAAANVAVNAARPGGSVALGGGAGQDPWGQWLLARLRGEGVDTGFFTLDQARLLTGEDDVAAAAEAISAAGVRLVVVTLGPEGALARGAQSPEVPGRGARVISTVGAGDAFLGTLLSRPQAMDRDPADERLRDALADAAEAGARATGSWGAVA